MYLQLNVSTIAFKASVTLLNEQIDETLYNCSESIVMMK